MKLEMKQKAKVQGKNVITFGRELTPKEKARGKLKEKAFSQMSRVEKDELLELLIDAWLIDTK
ncbi:hypothetical protein [Thermicanus aegyptius]|uniref:hypothetical protein n=1 Tax=Thermicanus aegyptius TaxID=94009 RepID=UPI0003FB2743|nr:hypothetical protein [Thermicanus aegyptius]